MRLRAEYGPIPQDALEAAAWWHELLDEADGDIDIAAQFDAWLEASADHDAAWRRVTRAWEGASQAAADPAVLAHRRRALAPRPHYARMAAVAAGLCLATALAAFAVTGLHMGAPAPGEAVQTAQAVPGEFVTSLGQRSTVVLDDGSRVELNTASRIIVSMEGVERHVRLAEGQALFDVAADPARPFVVEAGNRRITALGTVFDVRVGDAEPSVQVTMLEGLTRVERARTAPPVDGAGEEPSFELSGGEQLIVRPAAAPQRREVDAARVTSWRHGWLVFENEPLSEAVAEMNRYARRNIVLDSPGLADLRVSGVFTAGRSELFIEALQSAYNLRVARTEADYIVLARAE
ncbi:FecR family protein [Alkalicaulis satelles]|nr:FecR domain-containing protein [Alkalicaulis satelles]